MASLETRRIRKSPVDWGSHAWKDGTALSARFIADGDDARECLAGFDHVVDGLRLVPGNIDADFLHCFDDDRIEVAGLNAGRCATGTGSARSPAADPSRYRSPLPPPPSHWIGDRDRVMFPLNGNAACRACNQNP